MHVWDIYTKNSIRHLKFQFKEPPSISSDSCMQGVLVKLLKENSKDDQGDVNKNSSVCKTTTWIVYPCNWPLPQTPRSPPQVQNHQL